jgi:hypothetical protein
MFDSTHVCVHVSKQEELTRGFQGLGGTNGAVVVDLKNFQQFSMDDTTFDATIGAGTLLGDIDKRLHSAGGRAMTHGTSPQVGIGGHATIGGLGPTARQFGMALDHVLEVEVVLANGTIVSASKTENPDVFFAIRGAGASFGIVTEFKVRTEPAPGTAVQYSYTFGFGDTTARANLFQDWQSFISNPNLTRKFASILTILPGTIVISGTFFGTQAEFNALQVESRFPGFTKKSVIQFDDWLGLVAQWAETAFMDLFGGVPASFYSKSLSFTPKTLIPSSGIENLFKFLDTASTGSLIWFVIFDLEAGAINDVPMNATAYAHRDTLFWLQSYAVDIGKVSQTTIKFLDGINNIISASLPGVTFGAYPGYVDPLLQNAQTAYWGSNLPRLEAIKAAVDPHDVFHNPQSVQPASK